MSEKEIITNFNVPALWLEHKNEKGNKEYCGALKPSDIGGVKQADTVKDLNLILSENKTVIRHARQIEVSLYHPLQASSQCRRPPPFL